MSAGCKDLTRPTPIIYILRQKNEPEGLIQRLSSGRIHYCYIILRNVEKEKKKVCPFFLHENSRPLSPWRPLDSLSTCLGNDSALTKIKHKEQILKAAREKQKITHKGIPIRITADLSIETLQIRREKG